MKLTTDIKKYINQSVLCWLSTVSDDGMPNVSPKEIFACHNESIIIANIASPNTVKNIQSNHKVCISFVDVLVQKGYQLKGTAQVIKELDPEFEELKMPLLEMTAGLFPFNSITVITVEQSKPILAPRYLLYPDTKEQDQIKSAIKAYGLNRNRS